MYIKRVINSVFDELLQKIKDTGDHDLYIKFCAVCSPAFDYLSTSDIRALKSELPDKNVQELVESTIELYKHTVLYAIAVEALSQLETADMLIERTNRNVNAIAIRQHLDNIIKFARHEPTLTLQIEIESIAANMLSLPTHAFGFGPADQRRTNLAEATGTMSKLLRTITTA